MIRATTDEAGYKFPHVMIDSRFVIFHIPDLAKIASEKEKERKDM